MQSAENILLSQVQDYKAMYESLAVKFAEVLSKLDAATHQLANAQQTIISLKQENEGLRINLLQLKKQVFGSKHERFASAAAAMTEQPTLFNVEPVAEVVTETKVLPEREVTKTTIVSKHKGREAFAPHLRREVTVVEPQGIDTVTATKIGEDITETLAYTPSELYVKQTRRPRYATPITGTVIQAPAPARAIEKCSADSSLLAQIAVEKYIDHLPLYRQIKRYERMGVNISDSTMGDWVRQLAHALAGIYARHKELVLTSRYLHADETVIQVMTEERKGATHQGYYWVYQSHHDRLVLFDYRPGRGREGPESILKDYKGYLQTDGYAGYDIFKDHPDITLFYCMAHARRKFHEALSNDKERASYALSQIQQLYTIERHCRQNSIAHEALTQYRQEHAVPVLHALRTWMQQAYAEVLPKSAIGKALAYSLQRWDGLSLYATNGMLNIDNNPVENSIRPVALGRKNYLFAGSHAAAERGAIFYSLFATCKVHGVNPYNWLKDVLDKLAYWKLANIDELLPQNRVKLNS